MNTELMTTPPLLTAAQAELLHRVLSEQILQYQAIQTLLERKRDIVVSGQPQDLQAVDRELLSLSHKVAQLEQERQVFQVENGYSDWTLEQLLRQAPLSCVARLREARDQLIRLLQDTEQLNRENRELLSLSLQWIQDTVSVIAKAVEPEGSSYTAQGSKVRKPHGDVVPAALQSTVSHSV